MPSKIFINDIVKYLLPIALFQIILVSVYRKIYKIVYIYSKHLKHWWSFIICLKISIKIDALTVFGKTNRINRNVGRVVMEVQPLKLLHKYLSSYKQRLPSQPSFSCPTLYELIISNMNKTKM